MASTPADLQLASNASIPKLSLLDLPNEILILIAKRAIRDDSGCLLSPGFLNFVCRRIRAIVEHLQYEIIASDFDEYERNIPIIALIRTLMNRPCLGLHIRHIEFRGRWQVQTSNASRPFNKGWWVNRFISKDELWIWAQRGSINQPTSSREFYAYLRVGTPDAYLVLLLSFKPHLQSLTTGLGLIFVRMKALEHIQDGRLRFRPHQRLPSMQRAIEGLTSLQKLDYGLITHDSICSDQGERDPIDVQTLFNLPCISWARVEVWRTSTMPLILSRNLPYLRTLHLVICYDTAELSTLFDSLSNLSRREPDAHGYGNKLKDLVILAEATHNGSHHNGGLWEDVDSTWGLKHHLRSSKFLDGLQNLEVDAGCLFGWRNPGDALLLHEAVPCSLETLKLNLTSYLYWSKEVKDVHNWGSLELRKYFMQSPDSIRKTKIKKVIITANRYEHSTLEEAFALVSLRKFLASLGIELQLELVVRLLQKCQVVVGSWVINNKPNELAFLVVARIDHKITETDIETWVTSLGTALPSSPTPTSTRI